MIISPRNATLGEEIYRDIGENEYLHELYEAVLYNHSILIARRVAYNTL